MTNEQINLIKKSFRPVMAQAAVAADVFYNRLFESEPNLRALFPVDLQEQKQKLMKTLGLAVANLDKFDELKPVLESLGRKHAEYGVREEYYPMVGGALLWTLSELLGAANFDAATEEAWVEMFEVVSATMINAAHNSNNMVQTRVETAKLPQEKFLSSAVI